MTSDAHRREQLIADHYALVKSVARSMATRYPRHVELDELVSTGVLGLIDAVDRYDPARGVPFAAFAMIRIRGAIIDGIRRSDCAPRDARRRFASVESARDRLRGRLGREPTRDDLAAELGLSVEQVDEAAGSIRRTFVPLDDPRGAAHLVSPDERPLDPWIDNEERASVAAAIADLPEKERVVATLYYERGLQLKEIAAHLSLTEGRISQIRGRAVERLRARLHPEPEGPG